MHSLLRYSTAPPPSSPYSYSSSNNNTFPLPRCVQEKSELGAPTAPFQDLAFSPSQNCPPCSILSPPFFFSFKDLAVNFGPAAAAALSPLALTSGDRPALHVFSGSLSLFWAL